MFRLAEDVAHKIIRNIRSPELGPMDITQENPFMPKNLNSVGIIDCYAAIGTDFEYLIEVPYPYINNNLPRLETLDGYWLYHRNELLQPFEPFSVPRYLADPNVEDPNDALDVQDCSIVLPSDVEKLTCKSLMTFEQLITNVPCILSCLKPDLK